MGDPRIDVARDLFAAWRTWRSEGMSHLELDGTTVTREVDYHDRGAIARSLGLPS